MGSLSRRSLIAGFFAMSACSNAPDVGRSVDDASDLPVAEHDFRTRYHLEAGGRKALTAALASTIDLSGEGS